MSALIDPNYDNVRLTKVIRQIVPSPGLQSLEAVLPNAEVRTRTFKIKTYNKTEQTALYRSFDVPSPIAARETFTETLGQLPPISFANVISEDEELGIYERTIAGDWDDEIEAQIYDDAVKLADYIQNRVEIARGQVLETGTFDIDENGVDQTVTFGRPGGNNTTVGTSWATTATATPLADIRAVTEQSRDERDEVVFAMLLSSTQITQMLLNDEIRDMLAANGTVPSIASRSLLDQLLSAHQLPQIIEYDRSIDGNRVISIDKAIFIPRPSERHGNTQWGVTAEALKIGMAKTERPGLTATVMTQDHPVMTMTNVAALVMPVLNDPTLIYTLDTLP